MSVNNVLKFKRKKVYGLTCEKEHQFYLPFVFPMDMLEMVSFLEGVTCPFCQLGYKKIKLNSKPLEVAE